MNKTLQTPDFTNEAEEAAWWDSHPDECLALFEQVIRLDPADIELAKTIAQKHGLRYQTCLKMIIHQHLLQEATNAT